MVTVKITLFPEDAFYIQLAAQPDQFVETVSVVHKEMAREAAVKLLPDGEILRQGLGVGIDMRFGVGKGEGFEQGVSPADTHLMAHAEITCGLGIGDKYRSQKTHY